MSMCSCITIFSTGSEFQLVSNLQSYRTLLKPPVFMRTLASDIFSFPSPQNQTGKEDIQYIYRSHKGLYTTPGLQLVKKLNMRLVFAKHPRHSKDVLNNSKAFKHSMIPQYDCSVLLGNSKAPKCC